MLLRLMPRKRVRPLAEDPLRYSVLKKAPVLGAFLMRNETDVDVAYAVLRRRLMLSRTSPPIPKRISDVGSGWAAAVIEANACAKVMVAVACKTAPRALNAPARAASPVAITAKTKIPKVTLISFINRMFPL